MNFKVKIWTIIFILLSHLTYGQEKDSLSAGSEKKKLTDFYGFIRTGVYLGTVNDNDNKLYVPTAFSDLGLKLSISNGPNFKAFTDLRLRYGVEFQKAVSSHDVREAFIQVNGKRWNISAGRRIVKWGRADFTNPTSKISPQNLISRSPDREDMDMGNLLSTFNWYPAGFIDLGAVLIPYYRSSVLLIDPVPLPENVTISQINSLQTRREMFTYGLKSDFHLRGIDWSLSWFDGYDPMPGIGLADFNLDLSAPLPVPVIKMETTPYKTRVLGLDFETSAGNLGIRGETAWSVPYLSYATNEYVPWPEIKWVTGLDWSSGIWRFTVEYSGKYIIDYTPSTVDPIIGTEYDYTKLAQLLAIPGFDMKEYVRQQLQAFNRLYNYQLKRYYHTAGIRIEADMVYGKLTPSVFAMYNFTSRDFLLIPEIKYKPSDGLTITSGAEFYSGRSKSLYDIIDGFMNNVYVSLRVDF